MVGNGNVEATEMYRQDACTTELNVRQFVQQWVIILLTGGWLVPVLGDCQQIFELPAQ